jgi:hypothetical protein
MIPGAAPGPFGARVELSTMIRGRPGVVLAWFAPPDPEVGILRPQFVTAMAVDVDGEIYEALDRSELEPLMPRLRERAELILDWDE